MNKISFIFFLSILLFSCTEEVARLDLHSKNPVTSIEVDCKKERQIDFYLDCDIEFSEEPAMVMDFEFFKGEQQILKGGLDPLAASPKEAESRVEAEGKTHWKFYGKLEGNFIPPSDTTFTIKPTLIYNQHPDLKINKFELVLVR